MVQNLCSVLLLVVIDYFYQNNQKKGRKGRIFRNIVVPLQPETEKRYSDELYYSKRNCCGVFRSGNL